MTGFRTCRRGVSLRNESTIACTTILGSKSARAFTVAAMTFVSSLRRDEGEMLDHGSERQRRDGEPVTPEKHREAERRVVEGRIRRQPGECAAVVVRCRRERVEDLA